jgi:hypothetical protein
MLRSLALADALWIINKNKKKNVSIHEDRSVLVKIISPSLVFI